MFCRRTSLNATGILSHFLALQTPVRYCATNTNTNNTYYNNNNNNNNNTSSSVGWGSAQVNRLTFVEDALAARSVPPLYESGMERPHWSLSDVEQVAVTHKPATALVDKLALAAVRVCRCSFDTLSLYRFGPLTEKKVVMRCLFLETIAGVPGMVAGMLRHMTSLRRMRRDMGWISTLLSEAENERMHLMTFIELRQPGYLLRFAILAAQGVMFNFLLCAYLLSPRFVHRFVGYLEEEAVITYTGILRAIDAGQLTGLQSVVPEVAKVYWGLPPDAKFRELINVIRADEAEHRVVNHTFADMHARHLQHGANPFVLQKMTLTTQPQGTEEKENKKNVVAENENKEEEKNKKNNNTSSSSSSNTTESTEMTTARVDCVGHKGIA